MIQCDYSAAKYMHPLWMSRSQPQLSRPPPPPSKKTKTKKTSSIKSVLLFHNRQGRPAEVTAWKSFLGDYAMQCSLWICSISRWFHTEISPHSHFTLVSRFGSAILHIGWWCCVTTDCHTHSSYCHARTVKRELCCSGKNLKFDHYYSAKWVSVLTWLCSLWHWVRNISQPYNHICLA